MEKKQSLFERWLGHPLYRTLRVDILTLFLSLFVLSFLAVMILTYVQEKKAIEAFSLDTMRRASHIVIEKVREIIHDADHFPVITDSIILSKEDISFQNPHLTQYLLRVIKLENNFAHIFVASDEGKFIGASDLSASTQRTYITDPTKPLPPDARFSVLYSMSSGATHSNIWTYYDDHFQPIATEESHEPFDPRTRSWYRGAMEKKGLYWSDIFTYFATGDQGISVSQPLYNSERQIIGVTGVQLSSVILAQFLATQRVGESGAVYLLDEQGKEVVSNAGAKGRALRLSSETISAAYSYYFSGQKRAFHFNDKGVNYLVYVDKMSLLVGKHWYIAIIVPEIDFFSTLIKTELEIALTTLAVMLLASLIVFLLSKRISSPIVTLAKEIDKMKQLDLSSELWVYSNIKEITLMDTAIGAMRTAMRSFTRYVPRRIVQQLLEKGKEIVLGGDKKEITIFFSDIAGFTSYSEEHSTEEVLAFLFDYFDALSKRIIQEEGIIDKYIGDSIMAFWGAPIEIADHAERACRAALRCQVFLNGFNRRRQEKGEPVLQTRMTLNSGSALVGNIGTLERMNYTVIGDVINVAAHLQAVSKIYRAPILLTEETYRRVRSKFLIRFLDTCAVPGKKDKMKIYELIALLQGEKELLATSRQEELCALFTEAVAAFNGGEFTRAKALFSQLNEKFPEDMPTRVYLDKLVRS